ncbi:hypothetical protein NPIL_684741 [Nephila pilipes]|uniref:Uncharacterized protein n=1 Tax=Nephila pilipes TaxID=299642 RepID=A0A8X6NXY2_NEPPI|nr:hypothetical protein NPIL_684741 [Nephila pilipes]
MPFSMDDQIKQSWMRCFVARIPGWERLWGEQNNSKQSFFGTLGHAYSQMTSQKTSRACPIFKGFKLIEQSLKDNKVPHHWYDYWLKVED